MPEKKDVAKTVYKQYLYYIIIGIVSFVALVFLPMLGSAVDIGFILPQTTAAWVVFATTRLCVALVNVLIFHSFMEQGKLNIQDNADYIHANEILKHVKDARVKQPMAPSKWLAKEYGSKGVSIFISSMLATFAISQAMLTYDWITLISYLITIGSAIIFGILQMKKAEIYWTVEYPQYANDYEIAYKKKIQEEEEAAEKAKKEKEEAERLAALSEQERIEQEAKEAEERRIAEEKAKKEAEEKAKKQAEFEAAMAELKQKFNMEEEENDRN